MIGTGMAAVALIQSPLHQDLLQEVDLLHAVVEVKEYELVLQI
jgi:hypothetical protein